MKASLPCPPLNRLSLLLILLVSLVGCLWVGNSRLINPVNAASPSVQRIRPAPRQASLSYDIVYVRQPRRGDNEHIVWPEIFHPGTMEAGSDLILLHPNGTEEVLVDATNGAVTDPFVSFDGQWVYYAYVHDATQIEGQRGDLPKSGSDIFRIHLATARFNA